MPLADRIVRALGGTPASALPTVIDQVLAHDREIRGAEHRAFASTLSDAMVRTLQEQLQSAGLGRRVNGSFSSHSIVYTAISRAMTNVGRVPFKLAKPDPDGNPGEPVAKHALLDRLKRPHPTLYPVFSQMVEMHVGSLLAHGNTWTQADPVVDSKTRIPLTFRALTSAHVSPLIDPATWALLAWELRWGSRPQWVNPETLDQCKLSNPDSGPQILGLGPLQAAQQAVNGDYAMQRYEEAFFVNGGALSLLLKYRGVGPEQTRQPLKPDDLKAARLAFEDAYAGSTKMRKVGAINLDWDLEDLGITQRDMQFVEGRTWGLREIAMCFKTPAVLLNDQEKSALSGEQITAAEAQEARQVTVPLCTLLSAYYQRIFVDRYAPGHIGYFDIDEIEVLKKDFSEKVTNYCKLVNEGQVPARDAAALCDLGVDPDALPDVALVSFSLAPVSEVLEGGRLSDPLAIDVTPTAADPKTPGGDDDDDDTPPAKLPPPKERRVIVLPSARVRARRAQQERDGLRFARWRAVMASFNPLTKRYRTEVRGHIFDLNAEVMGNLRALKQVARASSDELRRLLFDEQAANERLRTLSRPYFEDAIRIGAEGVANLIDSDPLGLDAPGMRAFLQVKEIKVVGINETIREALRETLGEGLDAGETLTGLAERVRGVMNAGATRARTIARTEIGSSVSGSRFLEMHGQGVDRHSWLSSRDPQVRDSHQHVDGEEVAVGEPFSNGLLYVMDVNGPPEETVNCRCVDEPA